MHISISGQHVSISNALKEHVESRMNEVINKFFSDIVSVNVNFVKENLRITSKIVVNDAVGRHLVIKSNASCDEIYSAFDTALNKLSKQLRKYKNKLNNHHNKVKVSEAHIDATKYTISAQKDFEDVETEDDIDSEIDNPVIVAEKPISVKKLSTKEAVMQMDLEDLPALMFQNIKTGRMNVVYYRKDGNISWVDHTNNKTI